MARSVARASINIPGGVTRLKKHGYCAAIQAQDVWQLVVTSRQPETSKPNSDLPVVYLSRIKEDL